MFPLYEKASGSAAPAFFVGVRMLLGGILILFYQYIFYRDRFYCKWKYLPTLLFASLSSAYFAAILDIWCAKYLAPSKSSLLYSVYPFFSAIFGFLILSENFSLLKIAAIFLSFAGVIPMFVFGDVTFTTGGPTFVGFAVADLAAIFSVCLATLSWTLLERLISKENYDLTMISGITMVISGIVSLCHSWLFETWRPVPIFDFQLFMITLLGIMLVSNFICDFLYLRLVKKYSATFLNMTGFSIPLITAFIDWISKGRVPAWNFYLSCLVVGFSLFLYHYDNNRTCI